MWLPKISSAVEGRFRSPRWSPGREAADVSYGSGYAARAAACGLCRSARMPRRGVRRGMTTPTGVFNIMTQHLLTDDLAPGSTVEVG